MTSIPLYLFVAGFSTVLVVLSLVRSYLYDWDRSYLYSAALFFVVLANCVFWIIDFDLFDYGYPKAYTKASTPGIWFNHATPIMLLLLYREFLEMKNDSIKAYWFMTSCIAGVSLSALALEVFTLIPDLHYLRGICFKSFTCFLLLAFTFLPLHTFKFFKHPYYRFAAISSWVIWICFGLFSFSSLISSLADFCVKFLRTGDILFLVIIIEGILFFIALSIKDKLLQDERHLYEKRAINYQLKSLQNQMNPHFIFNSLNSIKSLNLSGDTDKANYYLDQVGKLIRELLSNTKRNSVSVSEEVSTITKYLELEKLRLSDRFSYEINISEEVDQAMIMIPPLMIQPYVENAVWHGISSSSVTNGRIEITIDASDDLLEVSIMDNGIGINSSLAQKEGKQATSDGLRISDERIRTLSDLSGRIGEVTIVDRSIMDKQTTGTLVTLKIPIV